MTETVKTRATKGSGSPEPGASAGPGHATPQERAAIGKAARHAVPLEQHAAVTSDPVDVLALLQGEDVGRVPELLPIRYGRMLASPFTYYRGAAAVMAADLAGLPHSGLRTQLCGDAHLSNFGVYASPERRLVFDVNDFDETLPGPFEWDVKRLVASLALAGRNNGHKRREREQTLLAAGRRYRETMRELSKMGNLAVWYASLDVEKAIADLAPIARSRELERTSTRLQRARTRDNADAMRKLTLTVDGRVRFINDPPLVVPISELFSAVDASFLWQRLGEALASYRDTLVTDRRHLLDQYELVDVARKVVGVGSVGTRAFVLLLVGRDQTDPLVLQGKEAGPSALARYCGASDYPNEGQRVVAGQRLIQAVSDIFLGWERNVAAEGGLRDFYIRQLRDGKASADVDDMDPRRLTVYAQFCAWTLARAHARAGDRVAIGAYLGKRDTFDRAVAEFAESYADRTEAQYGAMREAVDKGVLAATPGI